MHKQQSQKCRQNHFEKSGASVRCERGVKVSCVNVLKAICGMLASAVSWHEKFRKDPEEEKFAFDPCDPCVANRMMNDKQQLDRTWMV